MMNEYMYMMNDYMYVGGVAAIAVLLGLLLYVRGSRKEAEHEEVIEVGMADEAVVPEEPVVEEVVPLPQVPAPIVPEKKKSKEKKKSVSKALPKQNKVKLPQAIVPQPKALIEVATKAVEKDKC